MKKGPGANYQLLGKLQTKLKKIFIIDVLLDQV